MKKQNDTSPSTRPPAPSPASVIAKANSSSPAVASNPETPPPPSSRHGIEDAVPVSIQNFGIEIWNRSMTEAESEERTRQVVVAFQAVWKPNLPKAELDRLVREELTRRGLLPDASSSE